MSAPVKPKYRTTNWKQYNKALKRRGSLLIWLDPNMCCHGKPSGKRGRSQKYSEAAIQALVCGSSIFAFIRTGNVWIGASVSLGLFAVIWPHRPKASV